MTVQMTCVSGFSLIYLQFYFMKKFFFCLVIDPPVLLYYEKTITTIKMFNTNTLMIIERQKIIKYVRL